MRNSSQTSAPATALTITVTGTPGLRARLYRVDGYTSAGTSGLTVKDGTSVVYQTPTSFFGTAVVAIAWTQPLECLPGNDLTLTASSAGGGNTVTLNVEADQF